MSAITTTSPRVVTAPGFYNGEEFLHSIGDVPMARVIFDPWPGTATEQDLLVLVERDKRLCELIDGTLVEKPMGMYESVIASWLIFYLNSYIEAHPVGIVCGEAGIMRLVSGRIRLPDVAFISNERMKGHNLASEPILNVGPDLAVEVISESNTRSEINQKKFEYFESGARLMWVVYPSEKIVAVFSSPTEKPTQTLDQNGNLDGGSVLPGFTLELQKLFLKLPK